MNIEDYNDIDPAHIVFKTISKAGRTIQQIIYLLDGKIIQLWAGSNSKVHEEQFKLAWQIICQQRATIDLLTKRIDALESSSKDVESYEGSFEEQN